MTRDVKIGSLDFDALKASLKEFAKNQDFWTDYDFEGSGLDILFSFLAYTSFVNAFDASVVANEAFLETAKLRESVVKHAQMVGYIPRSITAATIYGDVIVENIDSFEDVLLLPKGSKFKARGENGIEYDFTATRSYHTERTGDKFIFSNVELRQGSYHIEEFINDEDDKTQKFLLPSNDIDTSLLEVYVQEGNDTTRLIKYEYVKDVIDVNGESRVFFLREDVDGRYEVYFGDGVLGKKLNHNALVRVIYFMTKGENGNNISSLSFSSSSGKTHLIDTGVVTFEPYYPSRGGLPAEDMETIRFRAPYSFYAQRRAITERDIEVAVKDIDSSLVVNVWGGERHEPPVYGKVFISVMSANHNYISHERKKRLFDELRSKYLPPIVYPEILDPDFINIILDVQLKMDKTEVYAHGEEVVENVKRFFEGVVKGDIEKFSSSFYASNIISDILGENDLVKSVKMDISLYKEILITNGSVNRDVSFKNPLVKNSLESNTFLYKGRVAKLVSSDDTLRGVDEDGNIIIENAGVIDNERGFLSIDIKDIDEAYERKLILKAVPLETDIYSEGNSILKLNMNDIIIQAKGK